MSSSSYATETSVAALLEASLRAIERDVPEAHSQICARVSGLPIEVSIDAERFALRVIGGRLRCAPPAHGPAVRLAARKTAIDELIRAERSLGQAVIDGSVAVIAPLAALSDLYEAFALYLHGAARCGETPSLLRGFRALCAAAEAS